MTIWILHAPLTPEQEAQVTQRELLALPFGALPDLSQVSSHEGCRALLKTLHPDEPPEVIGRRADFIWDIYSTVAEEDIIAVPLPHRQQVALAQVTGRYRYYTGATGEDLHLVPVKWVPALPSLRSFGKHAGMFQPASRAMAAVARQDERVAIRDHLPHAYNRFVKWKWLLAIFFILNLLRFIVRLDH